MNTKEIIGKAGIHCWLNTKYGKPKQCEMCGTTDPEKHYDWANIRNHKYERIRADFKRMCRSCHRKFDLTPKKKKQIESNLWWSRGKMFKVKLTQEDVDTIRRMSREGIMGTVIAKKYKVDKTTVYQILAEKTWKKN